MDPDGRGNVARRERVHKLLRKIRRASQDGETHLFEALLLDLKDFEVVETFVQLKVASSPDGTLPTHVLCRDAGPAKAAPPPVPPQLSPPQPPWQKPRAASVQASAGGSIADPEELEGTPDLDIPLRLQRQGWMPGREAMIHGTTNPQTGGGPSSCNGVVVLLRQWERCSTDEDGKWLVYLSDDDGGGEMTIAASNLKLLERDWEELEQELDEERQSRLRVQTSPDRLTAIHDQKKRIREKMHREASAKLTAPKTVDDTQQANIDMDEFIGMCDPWIKESGKSSTTGEECFKCILCDARFRGIVPLPKHLLRHHYDEMAKEFRYKTGRGWKIPKPANSTNDLIGQEPKLEQVFLHDEYSGRPMMQLIEHAPLPKKKVELKKNKKSLEAAASAAAAAATATSSSSSSAAASSTAEQQPSPSCAERAAPVGGARPLNKSSSGWKRPISGCALLKKTML